MHARTNELRAAERIIAVNAGGSLKSAKDLAVQASVAAQTAIEVREKAKLEKEKAILMKVQADTAFAEIDAAATKAAEMGELMKSLKFLSLQ